jgi:hypothetical protein
MKQPYQPEKKKYNNLLSLRDEMLRNGVKKMTFDGASIVTKDAKYTLYDSQITVTSLSG